MLHWCGQAVIPCTTMVGCGTTTKSRLIPPFGYQVRIPFTGNLCGSNISRSKFEIDVWEFHNSCLLLNVGALEPKFRCLALNGLTKPVWLDRPCTDQNAFICEKSGMLCNMEITIWGFTYFSLFCRVNEGLIKALKFLPVHLSYQSFSTQQCWTTPVLTIRRWMDPFV